MSGDEAPRWNVVMTPPSLAALPLEGRFTDREDALHEAAQEATGCNDFGDDEYREGLGVLLSSLDEEAQLSATGRHVATQRVVAALSSRLHAERGWRKHPACLLEEIEGPLVIVGLPRTGTTALHHLLARDPANQGIELWLCETPMPRPAREEWRDDPRFCRCRDALQAQFDANPELIAAHEMAADEVDECWRLFHQSFASVTFECTSTLPTYSKWWAQHDMSAAYRRHRDNLKLIGNGTTGRRWVLKDSSHLFAMEALFEVYPHARVIVTHRHPVKLIPSVCSLNSRFRAGLDAKPDPHALGREQLELWARGIERTMEARRQRAPEQFFDMRFDEFVRNPLGMVRRIYDAFGLELSPAAEREMRSWRAANPRGQHGAHDYTLEDYGLSASAVEDRFRGYLEVYSI